MNSNTGRAFLWVKSMGGLQVCKQLAMLCFIFPITIFAQAQKPTNDSCQKAIEIPLNSTSFGLGTYDSDSVHIDSAGVQGGEWFHASLISSGNDKKTIWYKFYIAQSTAVNIELRQTSNSIATTDVGFTTFLSNSCFPGSTEAANSKITTLNQFGSSFHPCLESGWYMVQISARARAEGKVYLRITTSYPFEHFGMSNVINDQCTTAFDFSNTVIGVKGKTTAQKDVTLGCYTLDDTSEYFSAIGPNYKMYNQTAWFKFKSANDCDLGNITIYDAWNTGIYADTFAYRLYQGDCSSGFSLIDSVVFKGKQCASNRIYKNYPCTFDSGKYYYLQFYCHEKFTGQLRFILNNNTSANDSGAYQPKAGIAKDAGLINSNKIIKYGFNCNSRMSANLCGSNAMSTHGVKTVLKHRYTLNQWVSIDIKEQCKLVVSCRSSGSNSNVPAELGFRLFKDTVTSNCADVDTLNLVYSGRGNTNYTLECLEPGKYIFQLLGSDSLMTGCNEYMHLGGDYQLELTYTKLPARNLFSLFQSGAIDSINVKNDSIKPLVPWQTLVLKSDTVSCNNTVLPESKCDTLRKKAIYRVFEIGDGNNDGKADSGLIVLSNLTNTSASNFRIYRGNAMGLRDAQNISQHPDTLKGLAPYVPCFSYLNGEMCITPGTYTIVSYYDAAHIGISEKPSVGFYAANPKFSTYSSAEFIDTIDIYKTYNGIYDTLGCYENPDTIDGVYCGNRNTYHVFYLDTIAVTNVAMNTSAQNSAGRRLSLFTGDIRQGKSGVKLYQDGLDWSCTTGKSTLNCKPLNPGWYTVVISDDNPDASFDSTRNTPLRYNVRLFSEPHRVQLTFSKPTVTPQKFDRPWTAANLDSLLNGKKPLSYDTNYSSVKSMPQQLKRWSAPVVNFQCEPDTPITHFPLGEMCSGFNTHHIVYYTFSLTKPCWLTAHGQKGGSINIKAKLYPFNCLTSAMTFDSVKPIQECNSKPDFLQFCNLPVGQYTLVYFIERLNANNATFNLDLWMDSIIPAQPNDFAFQAYDFGRIPSGGTWLKGKPGDVHPKDSSLPPSFSYLSCRTGSWITDPNDGVCIAQFNPFVYNYSDTIGVLYPNDSTFRVINGTSFPYINYGPRRNVWYTFTHKGPGTLTVNLQKLSHKLSNNAHSYGISLYESDVSNYLNFDSLKLFGGVDSTISQGLKWVWSIRPSSCWQNVLSYSGNVVTNPCDNLTEKRYYILVEANNQYFDAFVHNRHFWIEIKYDSNTLLKKNAQFDYISQASKVNPYNLSNLVVNGNAELGSANPWTAENSPLVSFSAGNTYYFFGNMQNKAVGSTSRYFQNIKLSDYKDSIQSGNFKFYLSFDQKSDSLTNPDEARIRLFYLNSSGSTIDSFTTSWYKNLNTWKKEATWLNVPVGCDAVKFVIEFRKNAVRGGGDYAFVYLDNVVLRPYISSKAQSFSGNRVYQAETGYLGGVSLDSTDYNRTLSTFACSTKSQTGTLWYKLKVDSSGFIYYNYRYTKYYGYNNTFQESIAQTTDVLRLYRETIPGDSLNGLQWVTGVASNKHNSVIGATLQSCVSPGTYYLQINHCGALSCLDYVVPQFIFEYNKGDFCSTASEILLDSMRLKTDRILVNCHTIGESYGENGSDMGCLYGPAGYKSSWYRIDYTDSTKADIEFKMANYTDKASNLIRYRTFKGSCASLTAAPCNSNVLTTFTLNCVKNGTYFVQVVTPADATGEVELSVETKPNTDSTCFPENNYKPTAAFQYNTACPENRVVFINSSSKGDSIRYEWDFGYNQQKDTSLSPYFNYPVLSNSAQYTVKLIVRNISRSTSDSVTSQITIPAAFEAMVFNQDTAICDGDSLWLKGSFSGGQGEWNTGDVKDSIKIARGGVYVFREKNKPNLLRNANAELAITTNGWKANSGTWVQGSSGPTAFDSVYYFRVSTGSAGIAELEQTVILGGDTVNIDSGKAKTSLIGYVITTAEANTDQAQIILEYLDWKDSLIYAYRSGWIVNTAGWLEVVHSRTTPQHTRKLRVKLQANNQTGGTSNRAYFDQLLLRMKSACDYTDSVRVTIIPKPRAVLGKDTAICYYDSIYIKPIKDYINPWIVNDPMDGGTSFAEPLAKAKYLPFAGHILLTEGTSSQQGFANYSDSGLLMSDSFHFQMEFNSSHPTGILRGDLIGFYLFHSKKPSTSNFYSQANEGYSCIYYEYQSTNAIQIYWNGALIHKLITGVNISDGKWHKLRLYYNNKKFTFYLDKKLLGSYTDNTARTQKGYYYGVGAYNNSNLNEHRIRNVRLSRSQTDVELSKVNPALIDIHWSDNSTDSIKKLKGASTFMMYPKNEFGCKGEADTIKITSIQLFDTLVLDKYQVCEDLDSLPISPLVGGGKFYGSPFSDSTGLFQVKQAGSGVHDLFYIKWDSLGCRYIDTTQVDILPLPTPVITGPMAVCKNSNSFAFSVNDSSGYFFGSAAVDSFGLFSPSLAAAGIHIIYYVAFKNGCQALDTIEIRVDTIPQLDINPSGPFCQNVGVQIIAANNNLVRFDPTNFIDTLGQFLPSIAGVGLHTISATITDNQGCFNADTILVRVDSVPQISISQAGPFCLNSGIQTLTQNNPLSRFLPSGFIDTAGNFNPALSGVGLHSVIAGVTDGKGCFNTDTVYIRVDSIPNIKITPAGPFCQNAGLQILATNNPISKFAVTVFIDSIGNLNPLNASIGSHKVMALATDGNGCFNSDSIFVSIDSVPTLQIAPSGPFCLNAGIQNISVNHSLAKFKVTSYLDSLGNFNPAISGTGNHTIVASIIDGKGCFDSDTILVQVDSAPYILITPSGPYCANSGIQNIIANSALAKYYSSSYLDTLGNFNPAAAGVGLHKIVGYINTGNGCFDDDSTYIQVDSIPDISISLAGPFCLNVGLQLISVSNSLSKFNATSYVDSLGYFNPGVAGAGSHAITAFIIDGNGCSNTDSTVIRVDSIPNAQITPGGPYCENAGLKSITGLFNKGGKFTALSYIDSSGNFNPLLATKGNHKIYYTFKDGNGCVNTDSTLIRVDSIPNAQIVPSGPFCQNAGIQVITPMINTGGKFTVTAYLDTLGNFNPMLAAPGNHQIYYTFKDGNGCSNTDSTVVHVDSIPNAQITPSGPFCENAGLQIINAMFNPGGKFTATSYIDTTGKFNPQLAAKGNHKIYYTFKDGNGCSNTDSTVVRVDSIPNAQITPGGPYCENAGLQSITGMYNRGGKFTALSYIDTSGNFNPLLATKGNHKIYYTFKDGNGCVNTDSALIRVDSIPDARISPAGSFCQNAGMQTIAPLYNTGGKFTVTAYLDTLGNFNPMLAAPGNHKIYYTFKDGNGCSNSDSTIVRVDSIPNAQITPSGPFCENAGLQIINAMFNPGGKFTATSYIDTTGKFNPQLAAKGNHKIYYTFKDGNGCSNTDSTIVRVDSIPNAQITPSGPYCENAGLQNITGLYNKGGKFTASSYIDTSGNFNPLLATKGNHKIYYTFKDGNGCVNTDSAIIRVDSIPDARISPAGPFCQNAGMQVITPMINTGGKFMVTAYLDTLGNFNPLLAAPGNHKIYYTFKDGNGCSNTDSTVVHVDSIPNAQITPSGPFCENAGLQNINALYNPGGKFTATSYIDTTGKFNPQLATKGNHKIYYTFKDGNGCSNTDSTVIRVDSIPNAQITPSGPFCENAGLQSITGLFNKGGKFTASSYIDTSGKFNPLLATKGNHKIYYTFKDGNGCVNTDSALIRVDSIPDARISPAGPFCQNEGIQMLSGLFNKFGKFSTTTFIDTVGNFDPLKAGVGIHKVIYIVNDGNGCSNRDSIHVEVKKVPDPGMIPAGPYCDYDSNIQLQVIESGGIFMGPGVNTSGLFNPKQVGPGSYSLKHEIIYPGGCSALDSMLIIVNSSPRNTLTLNPDKGCEPLEVTFETETQPTILWRIRADQFTGNKITTTLNVGNYLLQLEVDNASGCKQILSDSIYVYPRPTADFSFNPAKVLLSNPVFNFNDQSIGNIIQWNWNFGDDDSSDISDPVHRYTRSGKYPVVLYVTDFNGCQDSTLQEVWVLDETIIHIPTAITPNYDGTNDFFSIKGTNLQNASIIIFNRWGEKIYESSDFSAWDATYLGAPIQAGVYPYILTVKDNNQQAHYFKGTIKVIR